MISIDPGRLDDFLGLENVTLIVHEKGPLPIEVVLVEYSTKETMKFKFGVDEVFGFVSPEVYWGDIIHQWQKNWYEKYDKPVEDFENEGGPCVETRISGPYGSRSVGSRRS